MDGTNSGQCQLLDLSISSFHIQKIAAEIIYDMLSVIIVILNANHANSGIGSGQIHSIVAMIIQRMQLWSRNKETLEMLKRFLSDGSPMERDISL